MASERRKDGGANHAHSQSVFPPMARLRPAAPLQCCVEKSLAACQAGGKI